jgi:hypothetical protein
MASAAKSKSASGTQKLNRPRRNTVQPFAAAAHRGKRRSPAVTPIAPGISDYNRSQEVVEFACGITHLLKGGFTENPSTKIDTHSSLQPLGPAGIISPFNFPAMVSILPDRNRRRNTVVLQPSEKDPSASLRPARL